MERGAWHGGGRDVVRGRGHGYTGGRRLSFNIKSRCFF